MLRSDAVSIGSSPQLPKVPLGNYKGTASGYSVCPGPADRHRLFWRRRCGRTVAYPPARTDMRPSPSRTPVRRNAHIGNDLGASREARPGILFPPDNASRPLLFLAGLLSPGVLSRSFQGTSRIGPGSLGLLQRAFKAV